MIKVLTHNHGWIAHNNYNGFSTNEFGELCLTLDEIGKATAIYACGEWVCVEEELLV